MKKSHPTWAPLAKTLNNVLDNEDGSSCQKVRHIFSGMNEYTEVLSVNSQGQTVLEVVLQELKAGHKRAFYLLTDLLTDLTMKDQWDSAFKRAVSDKVNKDKFWNQTLKLYEDNDEPYWATVQWNEKPENCWGPIEDDD